MVMEERRVHHFKPTEFTGYQAGAIAELDPAQNDIRGPLTDVIAPEEVIFQRTAPQDTAESQIPDIASIHVATIALASIFPERTGFAAHYRERPQGTHMDIPRRILKGTLHHDNYRKNELDQADRIFKEHKTQGRNPREALEAQRAIVCAAFDEKRQATDYFLIQGHHKVRRAGSRNSRIEAIPSEVFTPDELADFLNNQPNARRQGRFTSGLITYALRQQSTIARESFKNAAKRPRIKKGVDSFGRIPEYDYAIVEGGD